MLTFKRVNIIFGCLLAVLFIIDILDDVSGWLFLATGLIYALIVTYGVINIRSQFFMPVLYAGDRTRKEIALTFDDGPVPDGTERILDILSSHHVKATFFCIGQRVVENPSLLQAIKSGGHIIGNHSYSHHFFFDLFPLPRMVAELENANLAIEKATSLRPKLFRPPYGVLNPNLRRAVLDSGFTTVGWSMRSLDTVIHSKDKLLQKITKALKPGSIYLFHDTSAVTIEALPAFIQHVKAAGYDIIPLDKMLSLQPYA